MDNDDLENQDEEESFDSFNRPSDSEGESPIPQRLQQIAAGKNPHQANMKNKASIGSNVKNKIKQNLKSKIAGNKQKNASFLSRFKKKKTENQEEEKKESSNSEEKKEENTSSESNNGEEDVGAVVKKLRRIKRMIIAGCVALLVLILMLAAIAAISAILSAIGIPFNTTNNYGKSDTQMVYDKNHSQYQNEVNYYKKIRELGNKYKEKCGSELNVNYLHASLIYYYYMNTSRESIDIDFGKMYQMIDHVAELMREKDACEVDYKVGGYFYQKLKEDSEFKKYYSELLKEYSMDEILEGIFSLGAMVDISNDYDDTFVSEDVSVNVTNVKNTETTPSKTSSTTGNNTTNNSSNTTNKINTSSKLNVLNVSLKDYLLGITYANIPQKDLNDSEKLKAYVVANMTNIAAKNELTNKTIVINIEEDSDVLYCNPNTGCSYTVVNGKKVLQSGDGKLSDGNNAYYGGKYYYLLPNTDAKDKINAAINAVYGYVLVNNTSGKSETINVSLLSNSVGDNYQKILTNTYSNVKVQNSGENSYANGVNYGNRYVKINAVFYDQKDYTMAFCRRNSSKYADSIASAGCGTTAMAIVVSTYRNDQKYDPVFMSNQARDLGGCGSSDGTFSSFFCSSAKKLGYNCQHLTGKKTSTKNLVTNALSNEKMVIVHVGPGKFTGSGHYIVLAGIDPETKKVYVYDPNNRYNSKNKKSGNGWYSFESVVSQVKNGYWIISKK